MATKIGGEHPGDRGGTPGTAATSSRLEKSRKLAQKRRETYKDLMTGIVESLPFSREVLSQLDYNSRLRLALCFLKMKGLLENPKQDGPKMIEASPQSKPVVFQPGTVQEMMIEAMDGFLMVMLSDGSIMYLSESIQKHLGLFQSEHMGASLYDLVLEEDHSEVKQAISSSEIKAHTRLGTGRVSVPCSFFCRMKCSRNKVANTQSISPGFKVVHTSGHFRLHGSEAFLVALVKPVTPPSILEIRMEGNMFVTHYSLDMKCIFFDGRLSHLIGYKKSDLEKKPAFDFHHHDDTTATMACSRGVKARGEGLSGYYRMLTKHGDYVWLQTRATMMFDSHTGDPSYIVCMNFVINKEKALVARKALPSPSKPQTFISEERSKAHDPFPIPREDGRLVNPLDDYDNDMSPLGSIISPDVPIIAQSPEVSIKVEKTSPPLSVISEEPSSTTGPPPSTPIKDPLQERTDESSKDKDGFHDNTNDMLPSSDGSSGVASVSNEECTPDSTTVTTTTDQEKEPAAPWTDSGYSSRIESVSSSGRQVKLSPTLDSSGDTSITSTPVPGSPNDVFITGVSGPVPIQPHVHSGSNLESQYSVVEPRSTVYQEPVIHELPTTVAADDDGGSFMTIKTQVQPPQQQQQQQQNQQHHQQQQVNQLQQQPILSNAPAMIASSTRLGRQPLGQRGDHSQQQSLGHHRRPVIVDSQVSVVGQPMMKQEIMSPTHPLPAGQYSIPSGGGPIWNGNGTGFGAASFQYQTPQQTAASQQPLYHPPPNGGLGYMAPLPGHQALQQFPGHQPPMAPRLHSGHQAPFPHQPPSAHQAPVPPQVPLQNPGPQAQMQQHHLQQIPMVPQHPPTHPLHHHPQAPTPHQIPQAPISHQIPQAPTPHQIPQAPISHQPGMSYTPKLHHEPATLGLPQTNPTLLPSGVNPQNLPAFSSLNAPYSGGNASFVPLTQTSNPASRTDISITPLSHLPTTSSPQTSFGVDAKATGSHMMSHVTPDLVNLTGEDLQILEYIDQLDTVRGSVSQLPTVHPQRH